MVILCSSSLITHCPPHMMLRHSDWSRRSLFQDYSRLREAWKNDATPFPLSKSAVTCFCLFAFCLVHYLQRCHTRTIVFLSQYFKRIKVQTWTLKMWRKKKGKYQSILQRETQTLLDREHRQTIQHYFTHVDMYLQNGWMLKWVCNYKPPNQRKKNTDWLTAHHI